MDQKIADAIAKKLNTVPGSLDLDLITMENNKTPFLPKTVSWIPGSILIDNSILWNYFFGNRLTVGYDDALTLRDILFDLNKPAFKTKKNGFKFTGKLYTVQNENIVNRQYQTIVRLPSKNFIKCLMQQRKPLRSCLFLHFK